MSTRIKLDAASIADELNSAAVRMLRGLRTVDAGVGLNLPRLSALSVVVFGGPVSLGYLAAAEQVRPPTMTRIVNALEEQGMVTKVKDEQDRRNVRISATMKGKKMLIQGRRRRIHALAGRIEQLDAGDRILLRKAAAVMAEMMRSP